MPALWDANRSARSSDICILPLRATAVNVFGYEIVKVLNVSVLTTCAFCQQPFTVTPSQKTERNYCSAKCYHASRRTALTVRCAQCEAPLDRTPSRIKGRVFCNKLCRGKWESAHGVNGRERNPFWKGGPVDLPCDNCGHTYKSKRSRLEYFEHHFCSTECVNEWRHMHSPTGTRNPAYRGGLSEKVITHCAVCSKPITRRRNRIKMTKFNLSVCSPTCRGVINSLFHSGEQHYAWKGGVALTYRGENWETQRRMALKRDCYTCQHCGLTQHQSRKKYGAHLAVHHIIPFREFGMERYLEANELMNIITLCISCHVKAERGTIVVRPKLL